MAYLECGGGGMETPTLLWENPNPNSAYAGNTWINIDTSPYEYLVVIIKNTINPSQPQYTKKNIIEIKNAPDGFFVGTAYEPENNGNGNFRFCRTDPTYGFIFYSGTSTYQYQTSGNIAVPLAIYGLKKNPIKL